MQVTTITEAKDRRSSLLERVKAGEPVLIAGRGIAVARIEPITVSGDSAGRSDRSSAPVW